MNKKKDNSQPAAIDKRILNFFASLSDETRLKILMCLAEKPRNVGEIHNYLGKQSITLSAISHQLKQLNHLEIVRFQKKGRERTYTLSSNFCWCILKDAFKHFDAKKSCCERCNEVK